MPCSFETCMTPNDNVESCEVCDRGFCENHVGELQTCEHCGSLFCDDHIRSCDKCDRLFCDSHIAKQAHGCGGTKRKKSTSEEDFEDDEDEKEEEDDDEGEDDDDDEVREPYNKKRKKSAPVALSDQEAENALDNPVEILEIHHVDVGQGESTLIIHTDADEKKTYILIDAGLPTRGGGTLKRYFDALEIDKLDHMICSHYDGDHYGGFKYLLAGEDGIEVTNYWHTIDNDVLSDAPTASKEVNNFLAELEESDKITTLKTAKKNDTITAGKLTLKCVYAGDGSNSDGFRKQANDQSIAWLLTFDEFRYYTAGDLPTVQEDRLIGDLVPDADDGGHLCAFKAGHHGSKESTSNTFLTRTKPAAAFVSCGYHSYRHPNQDLMGRLKAKDLQRIYLTNCFFNRKEANPNHAANQAVVDKSTLVGRVAGNATHLGTTVLWVDSENAASHKFHVGYYDDGSWGGAAGWRWQLHECGVKTEVDDGVDDDRTDHVKLTPPDAGDNSLDSQQWIQKYEWESTVYGYRQFFAVGNLSGDNQIRARNKYKSPLLRFGKEDGDTTERDKDYIDATEWLDELIWEKLGEVTEEFESSEDGELLFDKATKSKERNTALGRYKQLLTDEFNTKYGAWLEIVKQHETVEDMPKFVQDRTDEKEANFDHYVKGEYNAFVTKALGRDDLVWE